MGNLPTWEKASEKQQENLITSLIEAAEEGDNEQVTTLIQEKHVPIDSLGEVR